MKPHDDEWGPFPQFYLYVKTEEGTVRRDVFSEAEALRLTSLLASMLTRQTFHDPFPGGPNLGFSVAGKADEIKSIHLYRVDSVSDLRRLPSVDDRT
ncbi:MAG: hypothetical protein QOI11_1631 [Candidatus Eremiobacteraeota bacterium]|jgi:hypothetical protein|nr:hypothetical protein [Candidatus Eremiobacteraeota bacterium]